MTDSEKINLLLDKVISLDNKVTSLDNKVTSLDNKIVSIEQDIADMKADLHRLHRDDALILDEVERVHTILNKHQTDKSVHTA